MASELFVSGFTIRVEQADSLIRFMFNEKLNDGSPVRCLMKREIAETDVFYCQGGGGGYLRVSCSPFRDQGIEQVHIYGS